jgi:hypothetical protein
MVLVVVAIVVAQPADRKGKWGEDLTVFSRTLKSGQYKFDARNDVAAFDAEIASLQRDAGSLTDAAITLRLMKLVAAPHDGHSHVVLPLFTPFSRLPLTVEWYADGLAVTSAAPEYRDALGLEVTKIGTMTPEQVLAAVAPYISHENEFALRAESPGYLTTLELLQAVGAADASGRVTLALVKPDGSSIELTVVPGHPLKWFTVDAFTPDNDLTRRHPDLRYYWSEYLPEHATMYVQYTSCQDDPKRPFDAFAAATLAEADRRQVTRWVIDLRRNTGGRSSVIKPLLEGLARRAVRQPVFVLIGGSTFSAAIENAMELRLKLHATLVGEPTGGKPNIYGNPKTLTLPNSQLHVQYSTSFVRHAPDTGPPEVDPDVRVSPALADVRAGRDPVLETALTARQPPHLLQFSGQWTSPGFAISRSSRISTTASRPSPTGFSR